jgi:asparagine synthase (glutamine-hydrolysing)
MCGIAGLIHSDVSRPVTSDAVRALCDGLVHRGPDDYGEYVSGHVGIGMRRLSIIDLEGGHQPIPNEDETIWVVLNGEIYNYRCLREDLTARGHRLRTASDTEAIVHLYEEYGADCVSRLRGMFTFAIWDERRRTLLLARDRVGIKPLYYAALPEGLVFASELKALLAHPGIPRAIDSQALAEYFTFLCVPGARSILAGVRKLLPGHLLTYRDGRVDLRRYWQVQPTPDEQVSEQEWIDRLRERLRDAVESHLVADVPVGAFLSGGLDSGSMVALMARASAAPVRTFTIGFSDAAGSFDERAAAREVARHHATRHEECLLSPDIRELFPRIVGALDEPMADSSAVPTWLVCQETVRHVKVALSGLGGDELFGGYERYVGLHLSETYRGLPPLVRRTLAHVAGLVARNRSSREADRLTRFFEAAELPSVPDRYRGFISAFRRPEHVLRPDVCMALAGSGTRYDDVVRELTAKEAVDWGLFADLYTYLPDDLLTLTDRISMAHSLEVRVPFLDHELIEFVSRIPARFKVRGFRKKILFRRAIRPWVPASHLRRAKQGFSIPLADWLRGPLRSMLGDLASSRHMRESPWLDAAVVHRLVDEHLSGRVTHEVRLWAILCFLEWERQCRTRSPSYGGAVTSCGRTARVTEESSATHQRTA